MKKNALFLVICFLGLFIKVNAASCSLEKRVKLNNEAGAVTATSEPFEYNYMTNDDITDEQIIQTSYLGAIKIYNLTENLYAIATYGDDKKTINYGSGSNNINTISTGAMDIVKEYTVSVYPTDTSCGKDAIRTLQVSVPRYNTYSVTPKCIEYPDYFYCSKFLTVDNISREDFSSGLEQYISSQDSKKNESRHEGFIKAAENLIKKHWLLSGILLITLIAVVISIVLNKKRKDKERIV